MEQESFIRYYVIKPIKAVGRLIASFYRTLTGMWYCSYCGEYHSRRVKKYYSLLRHVTCSRSVNRNEEV